MSYGFNSNYTAKPIRDCHVDVFVSDTYISNMFGTQKSDHKVSLLKSKFNSIRENKRKLVQFKCPTCLSSRHGYMACKLHHCTRCLCHHPISVACAKKQENWRSKNKRTTASTKSPPFWERGCEQPATCQREGASSISRLS